MNKLINHMKILFDLLFNLTRENSQTREKHILNKNVLFPSILLFCSFLFLFLSSNIAFSQAGCCYNPNIDLLYCQDVDRDTCCQDDNYCKNNYYTTNPCSSLSECEYVCCCDSNDVRLTFRGLCYSTLIKEYNPSYSCLDICQDTLGEIPTGSCDLSQNPLSNLQITRDFSSPDRKIIFYWDDNCSDIVQYYSVTRSKSDNSEITELGLTSTTLFEDKSFLFSTSYKYNITAVYPDKNYSIQTNSLYSGDIECWMAPSSNFCIEPQYYLKYSDYFESIYQIYGSDEILEFIYENFTSKTNTGGYCNENKRYQILKECGDSFCTIYNGEPTCGLASACENYNYVLGVNPNMDECLEAENCFFEQNQGLTGLCLSCNDVISCYDYKSKNSCENDFNTCNVSLNPGNCEWIELDDNGFGVCIDKSDISCNQCEIYLDETIYPACSDLFTRDERFFSCIACIPVETCTNYTSLDECTGSQSVQINQYTHEITKSNDFCGLGACEYFENSQDCRKNIDLELNDPDCETYSDPDEKLECELDIFPPEARIVYSSSLNSFKLSDSLIFNVFDKTKKTEITHLVHEGDDLNDGYSIYLCSGNCPGNDFSKWNKFNTRKISACELQDKGIVDFKGTQTIYNLFYFAEDKYGNLGIVNNVTLNIRTDLTCNSESETRKCLNQKGVCENTYQKCNITCTDLIIGSFKEDCNLQDYNSTGNYPGKYQIYETTFSEESFDGLDNDCDGEVDEGSEREFFCDGKDDDNDGIIDNGCPDFDRDKENCNYNLKIKLPGTDLSGYKTSAETYWCGADAVDLDKDNDGITDDIDTEPFTPLGCEVYRSGDRIGTAIDSDSDGICDGLDQCEKTNIGCPVFNSSENLDLAGCPKNCRNENCYGDSYCQDSCECEECNNFYGQECNSEMCENACGFCFYENGECNSCEELSSCENYTSSYLCSRDSCDLGIGSGCKWYSEDSACLNDFDNDNNPDILDPCPEDRINDFDKDGYCKGLANQDMIGQEFESGGELITLKGGFDCDDNNKYIYPKEDFYEGGNNSEGSYYCDSIDNDCDGLIDEGCPCSPNSWRDCGYDYLDYSEFSFCKRGTQYCIYDGINNVWSDQCKDLKTPEPEFSELISNRLNQEYCDDFDNDCNYMIDEGCDCSSGDTIPCGTNLGICNQGYRKCINNEWSDECFNSTLPKEKEICNNFLDDDCDGSVDEGCPCILGQEIPCPDGTPYVFKQNFGASVCEAGSQKCIDNKWTTCSGFTPPQVDEEISLCDGLDNDCDGVADESCFCFDDNIDGCKTNCLGSYGTVPCENGVYLDLCLDDYGELVRVPQEEGDKIDGIDNDCDGLIDEGIPEENCDGLDDTGDGWPDFGCPDFDADNNPEVCDFKNPIMDENGITRYRTKDGLYWCGADAVDLDKDNDGITDDVDTEPFTILGCEVHKSGEEKGKAKDSDSDGICDGLDKCKNTPEGCNGNLVYDYSNKDKAGCPKDCGIEECMNATQCECRSCDSCEDVYGFCDYIRCDGCASQCALKKDDQEEYGSCLDCKEFKKCEDYADGFFCDNNPCFDNFGCFWVVENHTCILDSDNDDIPDVNDICPFDPDDDKDGDGYCLGNVNKEMYEEGLIVGGNDCDPNDPNKFVNVLCFEDKDKDFYGTINQTFCTDGTCPLEWINEEENKGKDCDDKNQSLTELCGPDVHCNNKIKDGDETDIDCGGSCEPCENLNECLKNDDCVSAYCYNNICAPYNFDSNSKTDESYESDVDCGGYNNNKCINGKKCTTDTDCKSRNCINFFCEDPTCVDNKKNGDETDIDCGGSCEPCENSELCIEDSDCTSNFCNPLTQRCEKKAQTKPSQQDQEETPETEKEPKKFQTGLLIFFIILGGLLALGYYYRYPLVDLYNKYFPKYPIHLKKPNKKKNQEQYNQIEKDKTTNSELKEEAKKKNEQKNKKENKLDKVIKEKSKIFEEFDEDKTENKKNNVFDSFNIDLDEKKKKQVTKSKKDNKNETKKT